MPKKGVVNNPKGRTPGSQNKFTMSAKAAFQFAFDEIGGSMALATWAKGNPNDFYKIYGRLIPTDLTSGGEKLKLFDPTNLSTDELTKLIGAINQKR